MLVDKMMNISESRLILALDVFEKERAMDIVSKVAPFVAAIKVNYPIVLAQGLGIVTELSKMAPVICDFKVADIPNTNKLIVPGTRFAPTSSLTVGANKLFSHQHPQH